MNYSIDKMYSILKNQIKPEYIDEFDKRFENLKPFILEVCEKIKIFETNIIDIIWSGGSFMYLCGYIESYNDVDIFLILKQTVSLCYITEKIGANLYIYNDPTFFAYDISKKIQFIFSYTPMPNFDICDCEDGISLIDNKIYLSRCLCGPIITNEHITHSNIFYSKKHRKIILDDKKIYCVDLFNNINYYVPSGSDISLHESRRFIKYYYRINSAILEKQKHILDLNLDFEKINKLKSMLNYNKYSDFGQINEFIEKNKKYLFVDNVINKIDLNFLKQNYCEKRLKQIRLVRSCYKKWYYRTFLKNESKYLRKILPIA